MLLSYCSFFLSASQSLHFACPCLWYVADLKLTVAHTDDASCSAPVWLSSVLHFANHVREWWLLPCRHGTENCPTVPRPGKACGICDSYLLSWLCCYTAHSDTHWDEQCRIHLTNECDLMHHKPPEASVFECRRTLMLSFFLIMVTPSASLGIKHLLLTGSPSSGFVPLKVTTWKSF